MLDIEILISVDIFLICTTVGIKMIRKVFLNGLSRKGILVTERASGLFQWSGNILLWNKCFFMKMTIICKIHAERMFFVLEKPSPEVTLTN